MAKLTVTDKKPREPKDSDFVLTIDFVKNQSSPTRIFTAATEFIRAFEYLDQTLVQSIDSNIKPIMMLEDVEAGSLKTWLKTALEATDNHRQ